MKNFMIALSIVFSGYVVVAIAQDECQTITAELDSDNGLNCSGTNQQQATERTTKWKLRAKTVCKPSGWRISQVDEDIITAGKATGQCGFGNGSGSGGAGRCPYIINYAFNPGWSGNSVATTVTWTNQLFVFTDPPSEGCTGNGQGFDTQVESAEGCNDTFCCSSDAATECNHSGEFYYPTCTCVFSPILLDTAGDGFDLTGPEDGATFDLNADGRLDRISWTKGGTDDGFLALDRNGNGTIDDGSELFGSVTPQSPIAGPNGFNALLPFDIDHDLAITPADPIFGELKLWIDANHNGRSEQGELSTLRTFGIKSISLNYHESRRTDSHGNVYRYWSHLRSSRGSTTNNRVVDVFLTPK